MQIKRHPSRHNEAGKCTHEFLAALLDELSGSSPEILASEYDGEQGRWLIGISPKLTFFRDHFPEAPVLPGVIQVDWAANIARSAWSDIQFSGEVINLKFRQLVRPSQIIRLALTRSRNRVEFSFASGSRVHSSGYLTVIPRGKSPRE